MSLKSTSKKSKLFLFLNNITSFIIFIFFVLILLNLNTVLIECYHINIFFFIQLCLDQVLDFKFFFLSTHQSSTTKILSRELCITK
jgi:hypothetical protein